MYQIRNVLNVQNLGDNNRIKQGDKSIIRYALIDANNSPIELIGKKSSIRLLCDNNIAYEHNTEVIAQDDIAVVDLVINEVLPAQIYTLEIIVDEKYIFPSDDTAKIEVTKSTLAQVANVLAKPDVVANIKHDVTASLTESVNNYALKLVEQKLEEDKDATRALIDTKIAQIHIPEAKNYDDAVNDLKSEQGTIKQSVQDFLQSLENAKTENANALQAVKTDVQSNKDELQASITLIKQQSDANAQNIEGLGNAYNQSQETMTQSFNQTIEAVNQNMQDMQADLDNTKKSIEAQSNASTNSNAELTDEDIKRLTNNELFKNAVEDEANRIVTLDKYRNYGHLNFVVTNSDNYAMNNQRIIFVFGENWKYEAFRKMGYDDYTISTISNNEVTSPATSAMQGAITTFPELGGSGRITENFDFKPLFSWAYKQFNNIGLPAPFEFRITRKLNGAVVATKDCVNNGDLTVEDVDTFTRNEDGATLEIEYLYKGEPVLSEYKLIKELTEE